jgi:hypothetical protein
MKVVSRSRLANLATAALVTLACGCGAMNFTPTGTASHAAATPPLRVQDCGVVSTGTPNRFVCNGKVYTSYQLAKLREDRALKKLSAQ